MPQKAAFKIAYDGEALRDHSMDVRDLAPALLSLGKLFDAANLVLNGDKATVNLLVKAHSVGSFEVALELFQSSGAQVSHFYHNNVDRFIIRDNGEVTEEITKAEVGYFTLPEIRDEIINESTHEAAYSIVALAFKDDNKWRLHDGNSTISVQMKDDVFRRKVEENLVSFSKGDILRCRVKAIQWRSDTGLKTEYEVLEIIEHIQAAKQMVLFKDDNYF